MNGFSLANSAIVLVLAADPAHNGVDLRPVEGHMESESDLAKYDRGENFHNTFCSGE
jgi:hypothetical protein